MSEKTKEKNKFYNTVVGWACIIWAVASIAILAIFTGLNQTTFAIMTFGQLFVIFGIILLINRKFSGIVSLFAGVSAIIFPALFQWGHLFNPGIPEDNVFSLIISGGITLIGLAMLVVPGVSEDLAKRRCRVKVEAEIIDVKETTLSDDVTLAFAPVYQYEYNGKYYTKDSKKYSSSVVPIVGDKAELLINGKHPNDVYFPTSKASKMLVYLLGLGIFISGFGMVLVSL